MDRLYVILGAGASKDCSTPAFVTNRARVPPLVTELFHPRYMDILGQYRPAQAAGAEIRRAGNRSQAVEQFIRERYQHSGHRPDQRKYMALPPYLQHVLHAASTTYTNQPDNYDVLVTVLTRLPDVVFVTLNYDTLLDDRLHATVEPINSLDAYVDPTRDWCLIKLHGSVNWGRLMDSDINQLYDPDPGMRVDDEIVWRGGFGAELHELRGGATGPFYYPALAVPVGEEDELVCPRAHVEYLNAQLADTDGAHLLVIGYSGYDQEVLSVFEKSEISVKSLYVVNTGHDAAMEVASRIGPKFGIGVPLDAGCDVPFAEFVQSDRLERFLDGLSL